MAEAQAQIVGHMVRFLPEEEKPHPSGHATVKLHPKLGAFVLVIVEDPRHYHTLASRLNEKRLSKDEEPNLELKGSTMEALQKMYQFGTTIRVRSRTESRADGTQVLRYSLIEKE